MVKIKRDKELLGLQKAAIHFWGTMTSQPRILDDFFYAKYSKACIKEYYSLKKSVETLSEKHPSLREYSELFPKRVWILRHYRFEILYFSITLILFVTYCIEVPIFKGWLAVFIFPIILTWLFLRIEYIRRVKSDMVCAVGELLEYLQNELNNKHELKIRF